MDRRARRGQGARRRFGNYKAAIVLGDDADARFNPDSKKPSERFKIGDVVEVAIAAGEAKVKHAEKRVAFAPGPEGAVVVIEVKSRKVRALVGGYQTKKYGLNRATDSKRQPGSSFKPFVFGAGIESGKFSAGTRVPDTLQFFEQVGKAWKPKNYDGKTDGFVLLRHAFARSINTVSIKVAVDTGRRTSSRTRTSSASRASYRRRARSRSAPVKSRRSR